jgi:hypothetical protein
LVPFSLQGRACYYITFVNKFPYGILNHGKDSFSLNYSK